MKNTFGNNLTLTIFGESHGEAIGAVIDGISPGVKVNLEYINKCLGMRQATSDISTPRKEPDEVIFLSGVKDGYTEGTPICLMIKNTNTKSSAYDALEFTPRPSHADYSAQCKYHGYQDKRGGGHFSGRITAPIVAAGALVRSALLDMGIRIGTHIKTLHGIDDIAFSDYDTDIDALFSCDFPTLSYECGERMKQQILYARENKDSVGGILECAIIGMPAGVGEPWFDTVESMLAHAMLAIPGVKGIEFGLGFGFSELYGSEANDAFGIENGRVITKTNNNAGINGGITNGMPITFSLAIKPTPSIASTQDSVNLKDMGECEINIRGRHDPAIIHRARAVVDAMCALVIGDLLITRYGTDCLKTNNKKQ